MITAAIGGGCAMLYVISSSIFKTLELTPNPWTVLYLNMA
jgi:hypothetical protein